MDNPTCKIHNSDDFNRITKGIKVARCMQTSSCSEPDTAQVFTELVVSDSLCCSYCNTEFEDKVQQRLHYKLDWHRYNLKQHLNGLKSISEDSFNKLAGDGDMSSLSGSELESDNEDDTGTSETGTSNDQAKNEPASRNSVQPGRSKKTSERRGKTVESDSDIEYIDEITKEQKLQAVASRHTKVFFENDDGNIFSIYRCLLHHKKDIPQKDSEMIVQALDSGKMTKWTVIMIGGGHFAAAVFQNGEPIVHKTFHSYTVRARQGFAQSSRANGAKSAGASLRRYNEISLIQHVQEILESWSTHISNSSVILYRAVGRYNRTVLFGGKNPPLDKNDFRIRPLPFPTRRATFKEVMRVYDIVSTMEIYGSAKDFTDCFPNSPRQPARKKASKLEVMSGIPEGAVSADHNSPESNDKIKTPTAQFTPERQHRNSRPPIDRAKPRKSPNRPLPDYILQLAQSSSESEDSKHNPANIALVEQDCEVDFVENLLAFQDTVPRYLKNKKAYRQKKKVKKEAPVINEVLLDAKTKLWNACKVGDVELLTSVVDTLLAKAKECGQQDRKDDAASSNAALVNTEDVAKLLNDTNEDGNTLLHLAALGGHHDQVWLLMESGSNPCSKNKKLQTPYAAASDKKTRNTFRRFMQANPEKFNYQKSQIPGPLSDEIEQAEAEKKRQLRKLKRFKEKERRKEFELKKQEENEKQRFLNLPDKEKRALLVGTRMLSAGYTALSRCFQCAIDMNGLVPFEYDNNRFCSMPCLKEHRLHKKTVI
ncbi:hypothetical protein DMN91_012080 [Ooceraea biroi]|uniref:Ankyrin repeat and zinc finger domain-containing protein n=1 Tax=Ooceraea biroi TaxID=2015173 RepID=A0A026W8N7_OOCBI|nr:ankyrin repeat and zinc finger domain-containing protein 1 [Ooceraea biroi]EZA52420.1 Ankyrin repeat and zinc finger domain-containing protein [Ooceraea biroi]RLU16320.1 hypothetical protein DMN91_012080 [Ooceraea biroi]